MNHSIERKEPGTSHVGASPRGRSMILGLPEIMLVLLLIGPIACSGPGALDERCRQLNAEMRSILTELQIPLGSLEENPAGAPGCIIGITVQERIGSGEAYVIETLQLRVISDPKLLESEWALLEDQSSLNRRFRAQPSDPQTLQWVVEHENRDTFVHWGARKTKDAILIHTAQSDSRRKAVLSLKGTELFARIVSMLNEYETR